MHVAREMGGFVWTRRELGLQGGKKRLRGEKPKYFGYCCLGAAPNTMRQLEGHTFGVQEENGGAREGVGASMSAWRLRTGLGELPLPGRTS